MRKILMLMAALVVVAMMSFVGCESNEAPAPAETPAEAAEGAPAPDAPAPAEDAPAAEQES